MQEQRNSLHCIRQTIQTDLSQDWITRLIEKGYKADRASIWILEGFLFYLTDGSIHQILSEVSSITATSSWLGFDCINSHLLSSPLTSKWVAMQAESGAPWIGTLDDPVKFLSERGWKAYLTQAGAPDAHYGRWTLPVVPTDLPNFPHNWYVTAHKG